MVSKSYTSAIEMMREISNDEELIREAEGMIDDRRIISSLLAFRAASGLSQADVASKLKCSQSRVSKLEGSNDADVRLGDLREYAAAIGCELKAGVMPCNLTATELVKCHAFQINKHMEDMAVLAQSDEHIANGIAQFFFEVFVNLSYMLRGAIRALPNRPDGSPYLDLKFGVERKKTQTIDSAKDDSGRKSSDKKLATIS